ncbi:hypothetical protein DV515_00004106 [Chloebia gouldiae]|uniref:Signal recognition particle 9 kDa protein n=1 Tax=Chloebia gouldiae TaxID=44316 RepID=A0A3L8SRQ8_CHLGU|nr:hypothetical protein DV515_00004106 [Chloebia gouldiae]
MSVRVVLKYRHCDGNLCIKVTDDVACLLYRTDQAQDVKKIEKFHSQLMRLMVAKESRNYAQVQIFEDSKKKCSSVHERTGLHCPAFLY